MADLQPMLRNVSLFAQLSDETLAGVSAQLHRKTFRKGTIIFHKDQAGDALYIVESGRVRIFLPTQGGEELTVDVAGPGDVFGELALLDGRPRSASADTLEDTVTFTISRDEFQKYLGRAPQLAAALVELLSSRLRHVTEYAERLAFPDVHVRIGAQRPSPARRVNYHRIGRIRDAVRELTDTRGATIIGNRGDFPETELAKNRPQRLGVLQNPDHCVHPGAIDHGLRGAGVPGRSILDGTDPAPAGPGVGR